MKKVITSLTAGLLVLGAQSLFAQSTNTPPATDTPAGHHASAEQREARQKAMKLVGLSKEDLKGLSGEDRRSKIKEAVQKFMAAEKSKKEAGSFTSEDQANVDLVKKVFGGHHKAKDTASTTTSSN